MEITRRYRVGVSTSVKGVHSYDCTVELTAGEELDRDNLQDIILAESDALVLELDQRYPPPVDDKKVKEGQNGKS